MRLDKFVSHSCRLTRKEAQKKIKLGLVSVDGKIVTQIAYQIEADDDIKVENQDATLVRHGYWMLNKPAGFICANSDPHHRTVFDLFDKNIKDKYQKKTLQIAGRLDIDTTGLVLITSDGQWNHYITSPNNRCPKSYRVEIEKPLNSQDKNVLESGIQLAGEKKITQPAELENLHNNIWNLTIYEGKFHQVKRMFAAVNNRVLNLHRFKIGEVTLDSELEPGTYRSLMEAEINSFNFRGQPNG